MKFIIVLLISIWVASSEEEKIFVHGPDTSIYYAELINGDLKIRTEKKKLPEVEAKYSHNGAIHPRVLWMFDYRNSNNSPFPDDSHDVDSINYVTDALAEINNKFRELNSSTHVEALLAGIVFTRTDKMFSDNDEPLFYNIVPGGDIQAPKVLQKIGDWLQKNLYQFESLNYDFFIFESYFYMKGFSKLPVRSFASGTFCDKNKNPGIIFATHGYSDRSFIEKEFKVYDEVESKMSYSRWSFDVYNKMNSLWFSTALMFITNPNNSTELQEVKDAMDRNFQKNMFSCIKNPKLVDNNDL